MPATETLSTRKNLHIYIKAPAASPAAFQESDRLPKPENVTTPLTVATFEDSDFDSDAVSRVADLLDGSVSFTIKAASDAAAYVDLSDAFNSPSRQLDVLVVRGEKPAAGAKNICTWGRYVFTQFSDTQELPGRFKTEVQLDIADGNSLNRDLNLTAFPSL